MAVALASFAAGPAFAQGVTRLAQAFKKIDANGDDTITLDEWLKAGREETGFKMIDSNGDGKMTLEELQAGFAKIRNR